MVYSTKLLSTKSKKKEALRRFSFSPVPVFHEKTGMSLISLLVAMVIMATLAVLLLIGVKNLVRASQGIKCANNLRQLGAATQLYTAEHHGYLPFYYTNVASTGKNTFGYTGYWYWHLAPYLNIPRWESNNTNLGPEKGKILRPNVFSCPTHGKNEIAMPLEFPTNKPISYAPSGELSGAMTPLSSQEDPDALIKGLRVADIPSLTKKAWLSDSTLYDSLNVSDSRWTSDDDKVAWARVPFTRHNGAGNVLFYDGHVERIAYRSMVTGDIRTNVSRLFTPTATAP